MKKWVAIALGVVVLALLVAQGGGLPYGRELEDMTLMGTMGVDAQGTDVVVTLASDTPRDGTEPLVLSGVGQSITGSCHQIQEQGDSYLYYAHVGQLLVGEEMATQGVMPILDYVLNQVDMRLDTTFYLVKGSSAGEAMTGEVASRLDGMEENQALISAFSPISVREVIAQLNRSDAVAVPALAIGEDGLLMADGYGILKEGTLVGWVEGDAAQGVDFILEQVEDDLIEVGDATLKVSSAQTTVTPTFQGTRLVGVAITCTVESDVVEGTTQGDVLERQLEKQVSRAIWGALHQSVELDADFLQLQLYASMAQPWNKEGIARQWSLWDLVLSVTVEGTVGTSYDGSTDKEKE